MADNNINASNVAAEYFLHQSKLLERKSTESLAAFVELPHGRFEYASDPPGKTEVLRRYGFEIKDDEVVPLSKLQDAAQNINFSEVSGDLRELVRQRCSDSLSEIKEEKNGRFSDYD